MQPAEICALAGVGSPTNEGLYLRDMDVTREPIGQETLAAQLAQRANDEALAHAVLLTGAPGRGGLALALGLARQSVSYTHLTLPTKRIV